MRSRRKDGGAPPHAIEVLVASSKSSQSSRSKAAAGAVSAPLM